MKRHGVALLFSPIKTALWRGRTQGVGQQLFRAAARTGRAPPEFPLQRGAARLSSSNASTRCSCRNSGNSTSAAAWNGFSPASPNRFCTSLPPTLTENNIRYGLECFFRTDRRGPFRLSCRRFRAGSHRVFPSCAVSASTIRYLSAARFPERCADSCGYWFTEQAGESLAIFPSRLLHGFTAPADFIDWIEGLIAGDSLPKRRKKL